MSIDWKAGKASIIFRALIRGGDDDAPSNVTPSVVIYDKIENYVSEAGVVDGKFECNTTHLGIWKCRTCSAEFVDDGEDYRLQHHANGHACTK